MPSIGIDYTPAYEQGGGIGRYVRELIAALAKLDNQTDYHLFVAGATRDKLSDPPASNFEWRPSRISPLWYARLWHRAQLPFPIETIIGKVNLYHATDFVLPPTLPQTRTLLTIHDLSFERVPDAASPSLKTYLKAVVPLSVRRAHHILADSTATKSDLVELYNTPPDKITVLLSGVEARFQRVSEEAARQAARQKYRLPSIPFIFSVGTVQPRKNYGRLIEALARLRQHGHDFDLVIAGGRGWLEDPIYETLLVTGMTEHVHFIGFTDDEDLPALYSEAACVAIPSLYEGFGIPVLEAMACGTPVVTSNTSSLPEVAGDAALLITPTNLDELTDALERLLTDSTLRDDLIRRGLERAHQFTWDKAAQQLQQIYGFLTNSKT